ncbi:hypothetical protein PAXINDRAFT_179613 [Paxillus involutus ATCC 200175]|nr:hypothetical protein PAXINDRAFT_179613 [Paxillus involutus ATCC 200175]
MSNVIPESRVILLASCDVFTRVHGYLASATARPVLLLTAGTPQFRDAETSEMNARFSPNLDRPLSSAAGSESADRRVLVAHYLQLARRQTEFLHNFSKAQKNTWLSSDRRTDTIDTTDTSPQDIEATIRRIAALPFRNSSLPLLTTPSSHPDLLGLICKGDSNATEDQSIAMYAAAIATARKGRSGERKKNCANPRTQPWSTEKIGTIRTLGEPPAHWAQMS